MKKLFRKDKNIRSLFEKSELNNLILKSFFKSRKKQNSLKLKALVKKLSNHSNNSSVVKINNRCVLTSRKRIAKHVNISRLSFLRLANHGLITGAQKINW